MDADFVEFLKRTEPISVHPRNLYQPIRHHLHHLHPIERAIGEHLPLERVLFGVELYPIKWVLYALHRGHKLLFLRSCAHRHQRPKGFEVRVRGERVEGHCVVVVEVEQPVSGCDLLSLGRCECLE